MLTDSVEFLTHLTLGADRSKVWPVHTVRHVVSGDAFPVSDTGSAMLVSAGVTAVGIA